jgi:Short C-terminal domain
MAARAGNRMQARQTYRTINRMKRRREFFRGGAQSEPEPQPAYTAAPAAPAQPSYMAELERLAQLNAQGVLTAEEYEAKKRQILGI